jgi:hypothetical protein
VRASAAFEKIYGRSLSHGSAGPGAGAGAGATP